MPGSLLGLFGAYGVRDVLSQGWEKLVLDRRRFSCVRGSEPPTPPAAPYRPPECRVRPRTVFLVCRSFYPDASGGTEGFTLRMAKQLMRYGCRVLLFTHAARPRGQFDRELCGVLYRSEQVEGVQVIRLRHREPLPGLLKDFPPDPAMTAFAHAFLEREKPDVVHITHLARLHGFAEACRQSGVPYLVTLTDFFALCHYSTRVDRCGVRCTDSRQGERCATCCRNRQVADYARRYRTAGRILRGAALVAAPSGYVSAVFEREFPGLSVQVIPHGMDLPVHSADRSGPIRRFGYVGQLANHKGVALLVQAFRAMPEDCTLELYGPGNRTFVAKLRRWIGSDPRIRISGAVSPEALARIYPELDCVVVPSLVPETYNYVSREALQSGCVVVAADIGALPEVVGTAPNGLLFSAGDPSALLAAMQRARVFRPVPAVRVAPTSAEESAVYLNSYPVD